MEKIFEGVPNKYNIIALIGTLIWSVLNVGYVRILSLVSQMVMEDDANLPLLIGMIIGYLVFWEIIEFYTDILTYYSGTAIENYTNEWFLSNTYRLKPSVIKRYNTGYINGLCAKLIGKKEKVYNQIVLFVPLSIIYVVYSAYQLSTYHYYYGIALLLVTLLAILLRISLRKKTDYYEKELTDAESLRAKRSIDCISNISTIQKMRSKDFMTDMLQKETINCFKKTKKCAIFNELSFAGYKLIMYLFLPIVLLIYYYNPDLVKDNVDLFAFLSVICVQLVHIAKNLSTTITDYIKFKSVVDKIDTIYCPENYRHRVYNGPFNYAEITDAHHKYYDDNKHMTTEVIIPHFIVNKGEHVCLYGESGQGKTTLLNILSGELESDSVTINGKKLEQRLACVFISQDTEMLDMTLRENLTLGNEAVSDEEIIQLIRRCGLGDWFDRQALGLDTVLGERGVFVSTGQRQRLNLIRGLLKKEYEVYLLDEPTSNVDEATEDDMIEVIKEYLGDKTFIVVTHRPKIKDICNSIYEFRGGICYNLNAQ